MQGGGWSRGGWWVVGLAFAEAEPYGTTELITGVRAR